MVCDYARVIKNTEISKGIFDLTIDTGNNIKTIPGQFVNLYPNDKSLTLPRPLAICDASENKLRMVYAVVGKGTGHFSLLKQGDGIRVMYPLGNGFSFSDEERTHVLVGGSVGLAPLLYLAKSLKGVIHVLAGFESEPVLTDEFKAITQHVHVATETGKYGERGNVLDLLEKYGAGDMYYACGTTPMLKAVCGYLSRINAKGQISGEARMGCGYGVCVCCAVRIKTGIGYEYLKACVDGPVFNYREVLWD
jgi:dihydroorotate dehydrogenase electron transfer subunit